MLQMKMMKNIASKKLIILCHTLMLLLSKRNHNNLAYTTEDQDTERLRFVDHLMTGKLDTRWVLTHSQINGLSLFILKEGKNSFTNTFLTMTTGLLTKKNRKEKMPMETWTTIAELIFEETIHQIIQINTISKIIKF